MAATRNIEVDFTQWSHFRPAMLVQPSTLLLLATGLLPLAGVVFLNWDAFLLLMAYWMEGLIVIAFFIARFFALRDGPAFETSEGLLSRIGTVLLGSLAMILFLFFFPTFVLFLGIYFELGADWHPLIGGPGDFIRVVVVQSGIWIALLPVLAERIWAFVRDVAWPQLAARDAARPAGRRIGKADELRGPDHFRRALGEAFGLNFYVLFVFAVMCAARPGQGAMTVLVALASLRVAISLLLHLARQLPTVRKTVTVAA